MLNPATLEWRPRALLRFDLLIDEIGQHNAMAADDFARLVTKKIGLASRFPMLYRASSRVSGTREIVHWQADSQRKGDRMRSPFLIGAVAEVSEPAVR